jgi:hypothetical protein
MFSFDPDFVARALVDAQIATWEWSASTDELRWTSGQTDLRAPIERAELNVCVEFDCAS